MRDVDLSWLSERGLWKPGGGVTVDAYPGHALRIDCFTSHHHMHHDHSSRKGHFTKADDVPNVWFAYLHTSYRVTLAPGWAAVRRHLQRPYTGARASRATRRDERQRPLVRPVVADRVALPLKYMTRALERSRVISPCCMLENRDPPSRNVFARHGLPQHTCARWLPRRRCTEPSAVSMIVRVNHPICNVLPIPMARLKIARIQLGLRRPPPARYKGMQTRLVQSSSPFEFLLSFAFLLLRVFFSSIFQHAYTLCNYEVHLRRCIPGSRCPWRFRRPDEWHTRV
jgi:hypothetical protein